MTSTRRRVGVTTPDASPAGTRREARERRRRSRRRAADRDVRRARTARGPTDATPEATAAGAGLLVVFVVAAVVGAGRRASAAADVTAVGVGPARRKGRSEEEGEYNRRKLHRGPPTPRALLCEGAPDRRATPMPRRDDEAPSPGRRTVAASTRLVPHLLRWVPAHGSHTLHEPQPQVARACGDGEASVAMD